MGKLVTGWEDHGTHLRVFADVPLRRNGLPNTGALKRALAVLDEVNPDAFDPVEPVPEAVAFAATRDGVISIPTTPTIPHFDMTADSPPLPDFGIPLLDAGLLPDDDEIIFPRACPAGGCGED